MTQRDRDRLVVLKKAQKKLITQEQAAEEFGMTATAGAAVAASAEKEGDKAVIHGLRGRPSNRKRTRRPREDRADSFAGGLSRFRADAGERISGQETQVKIGREALRQIMMAAGLWRARKRKVEAYTSGDSGAVAGANWCSGTPASTTGWKDAARGSI